MNSIKETVFKSRKKILIDFYKWTEDQVGFGTSIEECEAIVDMYLKSIKESEE